MHVALYDVVDANPSIVCVDAPRVLSRGQVRGSVAPSSAALLNIVLIWLGTVHVILSRTVVQDGQIIEEYLVVVAVGGTWRWHTYLPLRVVGLDRVRQQVCLAGYVHAVLLIILA